MVLQASAGLYLILVPTDHYFDREFTQATAFNVLREFKADRSVR